MRIVKTLLPAILVVTLLSSLSLAAQPDRITRSIDPTSVVTLTGHVSGMARPEFDQGPVEPSRMLQVSMMFSPTAQQQQALLKLLADQQDSTSPNFHKWLTADQYGDRFGLSLGDIARIGTWLQSQGLKVTYVAHGRDFLSFEGSAAQVESAFRTQIHTYSVNGKAHFANVLAPSVPAALGGIISGFLGLHNFFPRPMLKPHPAYTASSTFHALAPGDLATIYDINPLYQKTPAIDGTGLTVAIMAQTDVYIADLNDYRSAFGISSISGCTMDATNTIIKAGACTSGNFQMVVPDTDPGVSVGDLGESDLDIETMSAVARGAQVIFVTSANGVDVSAQFAIDNQLAPVMSYSYGLCEAFVTAPNVSAFEPEFQKANSLGISFFAASGDAASATCDGDAGNTLAVLGPSVSYPASSAYVTGVGGTELNEGNGTYWNSTNGADGGSAKSYIPEIGWNDTALSINNGNGLDGTGGGPSNCAFGSGTTLVTVGPNQFQFEVCNAPPNGGFPKPTWQSGITPNDSVRDVPDISFSGSNANDPYIVCTPIEVLQGGTTTTSTCAAPGGIQAALMTYNSAFGGTSASTPVAAGMTVLLNQYLGANGLGLLNPQLYKLYGTNVSAFHDVVGGTNSTTGGTSDNIVSCSVGTPSFEPTALRCPNTGIIGFSAGTGYDLVTGLGTVDFNALFTAWPTSRTTATTTTISPSATKINPGQSVTFTATVTPSTAVGSVSFVNNGNTTLGTALIGATNSGEALFATTTLPAGSNSVTAVYLGDASRLSSTSAPTVVQVSDFALSSNPTTVTVVAGHTSSNVTVTVTPQNGYAQATTLSCTGLPTGSICNFSPNPVTPPTPVTAATSIMTILTNANMGAAGPTNFMISATNGGSLTHTSSFSLTTTATDQSFTLAPGAASYQVTQGGTVNNATVTLTPTNGFNTTNSPVTYTCSDQASESICTVSGTTATTATFNITTTAKTGSLRKPLGRSRGIFYAALLPGLLGIMFTAGSRRRSLRGMRLLGLIVALGVSTLWMGACSNSSGGGGNPGTPTGTYSITINATTGGANPVTAQTMFNLVVQ